MPTSELSDKERPVFLTVICIICYVILGFNLFYNIIQILSGHIFRGFKTILSKIESDINYDSIDSAYSDFIINLFGFGKKYAESAVNIALTSLLLSSIALFGVIMMWNLKKTGFYLYTTAQILLIILPFVFLGINYFTIISVSVSGLLIMIFIILFSLNLKHMR